MGSAIKQRTQPSCVIFGLWNDFVAYFLCRVLGKSYFCIKIFQKKKSAWTSFCYMISNGVNSLFSRSSAN